MHRFIIFFLVFLPIQAQNQSVSSTFEIREQLCTLPYSIGMQNNLVLPIVSNVPFSPDLIKATETLVTSTSLVAVLTVSPTSVTQGARGTLSLKVANCEEDVELENKPLDWSSSPTQLAIGENELSYHTGAVAGNWIVISGFFILHSGIAKYFGPEKLRYPGAIVLPVLFFWPPTASSSVFLSRFGDLSQKILGICSLTAQTATGLATLAMLLPRNFKANWNPETLKWIDTTSPGYVLKYGMLFKDYEKSRQWFVGVEMIFSIFVGVLDGYGTAQQTCANLLAAGTTGYGTYSLAAILLRPNRYNFDKAFLIAVSSAQFGSILINVVGNAAESPTLQKIGNGLATVTQWLIAAKGVYDTFRQFRALYKYVHSFASWKDAIKDLIKQPKQLENTPATLVAEADSDIELDRLSVDLGVPLIPTPSRTPTPSPDLQQSLSVLDSAVDAAIPKSPVSSLCSDAAAHEEITVDPQSASSTNLYVPEVEQLASLLSDVKFPKRRLSVATSKKQKDNPLAPIKLVAPEDLL